MACCNNALFWAGEANLTSFVHTNGPAGSISDAQLRVALTHTNTDGLEEDARVAELTLTSICARNVAHEGPSEI